MSPQLFSLDLHRTTCKAIAAVGYMPKHSKYRNWSYRLIAGDLEASKYHKLRDRLVRFYGNSWEE